MPEPITITVTGRSEFNRPAERAVLTIKVSSRGPNQTTVSQDVRSTVKTIQNMLNELNPKLESGKATDDAAITHWSMSNLSTGSIPNYEDGKQVSTDFTASTSFAVKFRDFSKLGVVASDLSTVPHVNLSNIDWRLTDATAASLASQSRTSAAEDALSRATDYARPFGCKQVVAFEIHDSSTGLPVSQAASMMRSKKMMMMKHMDGRPGDDVLSFQPEDVSLSSTVTIKFRAE